MEKRSQIDVIFAIGEKCNTICTTTNTQQLIFQLEEELSPKYHYFDRHTLINYRLPHHSR